MHFVLSMYPLSNAYRATLERAVGSVSGYLTVTELRQRSLWRLVRDLFAVYAERLTVAIEDESSRGLLPVLSLFAAVTRARHLEIRDTDQTSRRLSRWQAVWSGLHLVLTSAAAAVTLVSVMGEMRRLLSSPRVHVSLDRTTKRVAYLNCNLWFGVKAGGSVGHISGVANAFMDLGYALDFFSVGGRLMVRQEAEYRALPPPRMLAMPFETTFYRFDRSCTRTIDEVMRGHKPAFIYQRMSLGNFTGVKLSRQYRVPLVLEYNGSEVWVAKNWGRPLRFEKTGTDAENVCLRHAHVVVTVSEVLRKELQSRGVTPERIVVYANCIDPNMFDPLAHSAEDLTRLRTEVGLQRDDVVATFIGTFGQWHGVDLLANAVRHMIEHERAFLDAHRLRFLLVGDGLKMPVVRETLGAHANGPYVKLTGLVPQADAPRYLAASDLLLSPHVRNKDGTAFFGSPTKLFEYLAMAKGIIASDLDQLGDILRPAIEVDRSAMNVPDVRDAVAVLVPPGNTPSLVAAIKLLVEDPELRAVLGANARRLALDRYTWKHHTQAILDGLARVQ